MKHILGIAAIGLTVSFGVTWRLISHATGHQPISVTAFETESKTDGGDLMTSSPRLLHEGTIPLTQTSSQPFPETEQQESFERVIRDAIAQNLHHRPMGETIQALATQFLDTPYKAGLLERGDRETLVVSLNAFDCVLLVETVLAIARGIIQQDYSYPTFINHLRDQRYSNGEIDGYCSRLHYFSAWIAENQKRGTVVNITPQLGGVSMHKKLNFISTHRQNYPRIAKNDALYNCVVEMESDLDNLTFSYIPNHQIHRIYAQLQPGDIVAIATNTPGLDVTHTGFVYRSPDGKIGLLHASPVGRVTIARDLQTYASRVKNAIGIVVARPLDPRH